MNKTTQPEITVFRDQESGAWFYAFSYRWVCYRAGQGYQSKELAREVAEQHFARIKG